MFNMIDALIIDYCLTDKGQLLLPLMTLRIILLLGSGMCVL